MQSKNVHDVLRDRLLSRAGLLDPLPQISLEALEKEIRNDVWDFGFLQYMWNRLLMGRLRYGPKKPGAAQYDYTGAIETKIKQYKETGNTECLVDIGNYAMLEFRHGKHPRKHFAAEDDVAHAKLK